MENTFVPFWSLFWRPANRKIWCMFTAPASRPIFDYENIIFPEGVNSVYGKNLDNPETFRSQVKELSGRTWFVFSHPEPAEGIEYIEEYVESLKLLNLREFSSPGASAFLVQLP